MMKRIFALVLCLGICSAAFAQGTGNSFPTPNGQTTGGSAILVPCGSIVNGQVAMCPPGANNGLPVSCTNCSPSAPIGAASNVVSGTITVTNTFQQLIALNASRKGCTFQNNGTHNMFFSLAGTPTLINSFIVPPQAIFYCSGSSNVVVTDQIQITGTAGDAFAGAWQ